MSSINKRTSDSSITTSNSYNFSIPNASSTNDLLEFHSSRNNSISSVSSSKGSRGGRPSAAAVAVTNLPLSQLISLSELQSYMDITSFEVIKILEIKYKTRIPYKKFKKLCSDHNIQR